VLDAAAIGTAARSVVLDPTGWADWAAPTDVLQHLKLLSHVLVLSGNPAKLDNHPSER
jgi:hypothetical protein